MIVPGFSKKFLKIFFRFENFQKSLKKNKIFNFPKKINNPNFQIIATTVIFYLEYVDFRRSCEALLHIKPNVKYEQLFSIFEIYFPSRAKGIRTGDFLWSRKKLKNLKKNFCEKLLLEKIWKSLEKIKTRLKIWKRNLYIVILKKML